MSSFLKPVEWVGSSLEDLKEFPEAVQQVVGYALYLAQCGDKHPYTKPLKGFKGAGVLEVVENFDTDTYRAVYTVKFAGVIYVLHAFQKKSKHGIATPKQDIDLIETRLKRAKEHYAENYKQQQKDEKNDSGN
jgi:phage-related protein